MSHQQQWATNHGPPVPQKQVWNQRNNTRHLGPRRHHTQQQTNTTCRHCSRRHRMPSAEGRDMATKAADAPQIARTWLEASVC
jgi:hypothetical protein